MTTAAPSARNAHANEAPPSGETATAARDISSSCRRTLSLCGSTRLTSRPRVASIDARSDAYAPAEGARRPSFITSAAPRGGRRLLGGSRGARRRALACSTKSDHSSCGGWRPAPPSSRYFVENPRSPVPTTNASAQSSLLDRCAARRGSSPSHNGGSALTAGSSCETNFATSSVCRAQRVVVAPAWGAS